MDTDGDPLEDGFPGAMLLCLPVTSKEHGPSFRFYKCVWNEGTSV